MPCLRFRFVNVRRMGVAALPGLVLIGLSATPARSASLPLPPCSASSPPIVAIFGESATGPGTETINGSVDPCGQATTYKALYDRASSTWCSAGGAGGTPAYSTPAQSLHFSYYYRYYRQPAPVGLSGLTPGTRYCLTISATNGSGTVLGRVVAFTAGVPEVHAYNVTTTSPSTATVYAAVNPAGQPTTYSVRYGPASSAWCTSNGASGTPTRSTTAQTLPYADGALHDVWVSLPGLVAGTGYCAAISASNPTATASSPPASFTEEVPAVVNNSVSVSGTTATVNGAVNALGPGVYYEDIYDLASSTWCATNGSTPDSTTVHDGGIAFPYSDAILHPVSVTLSLSPSTGYCVTFEASNPAGGSTQAVPLRFATGAP